MTGNLAVATMIIVISNRSTFSGNCKKLERFLFDGSGDVFAFLVKGHKSAQKIIKRLVASERTRGDAVETIKGMLESRWN